MLLGIAYFPPVSYFALIAKGMVLSPENTIPSIVYIEACENYQNQSWRNRCRILAADGPAYLNFPSVHEGSHELPITAIKVDYSTPWVLKTKRAIASAYESSAFFDYYKDELFAILDSHPETLFELDMRIIRFFYICRKTGRTDMRKSIDGLMSVIRDTHAMDPFANALYLFCGRKTDRIKALHYDQTGFVVLYEVDYYSRKMTQMR